MNDLSSPEEKEEAIMVNQVPLLHILLHLGIFFKEKQAKVCAEVYYYYFLNRGHIVTT